MIVFLNFIQTFFALRIELRDASSIAGRVKLDFTPFSHPLPNIINMLLLLENMHPSLLGMVALDTLPSTLFIKFFQSFSFPLLQIKHLIYALLVNRAKVNSFLLLLPIIGLGFLWIYCLLMYGVLPLLLQ